ncbi:MAG: GHKL domain-containing protein [Lachnospira sp.]|nr:GHKL domain-containing protein [Lachnospira sp.]
MSVIIWMSLAVTLGKLPGILIRYRPFESLVSKKQRKQLVQWYGCFLILNFLFYVVAAEHDMISILFYKWVQMIDGAVLAIINIAVIRGWVKEHLFTAGLSAVWTLLAFTITMYIQHLLIHVDVMIQIGINSLCLTGVMLALYPLIRSQMVRTVTPFLRLEQEHHWNNIWFIPYAMYLACYFAIPEAEYPTDIRMVLSRLFMSVAVLFVCRSVADNYASIREKQMISEQLGRQKKYYEVLSTKVLEARQVRHDFKHHIAAIKGYLDGEQPEQIRVYCDELLFSQYGNVPIPCSGNAAVDGILYHYMKIAKEKNIQFEIKGTFEQIGIKDMDLCVLLGNALDNAVSACEKIEQKRFITLSVKLEGMVAAIMISNSFDSVVEREKDKILSRKRKRGEGLGLKSIGDICDKYGGSMQIKCQDYVFTSLCLMNVI